MGWREEGKLPNAVLHPDLVAGESAFGVEEALRGRLERLQAAVEGARVDDVDGRVERQQLVGQLGCLLLAVAGQGRVRGDACRRRREGGALVFARVGVHDPVHAELRVRKRGGMR